MADPDLDYLNPADTYTDSSGRPTRQFILFWMRFINAIKAAFADIAATAASLTALALRVTGLEAVPYVTMGNSSATSAERALAATAPIVLTDGGANGSATLTHATSGVSAGTYGSGTSIPQFTVDARGHVTAVTAIAVTNPGSWIPLVDGSEPPNLITDGAGNLILVAYS